MPHIQVKRKLPQFQSPSPDGITALLPVPDVFSKEQMLAFEELKWAGVEAIFPMQELQYIL